MKEKIKALPGRYDYYREIRDKTCKMGMDIFGEENHILNMRLYDLVLNICNQAIYDYTYTFNKDDLYFIVEYNINIENILETCKRDIIKMKASED